MKKIVSCLLCFGFSLAFIPSVLAVTLTGSMERSYSADPGGTIEDSFDLTNTEKEPRELVIKIEDFKINPEDRTSRIYGVESSNGMKDWIEFIDEPAQLANPGEQYDIKYKINVPKEATPGTYMTSFGLMANKPTAEGGEPSGVAMASKILGHIYLTVNGDFNEELEITEFSLNKDKFADGEVVFNIDVLNKGDVSLAASGTIIIFDSTGAQIKGVNAKTQIFDTKEVVTERSDALIINSFQKVVLPGAPTQYQVPWTHRQVGEGDYTAKLELFYGQDENVIKKELEFKISQNFAILDLKSESLFSASLPVNFKAKLANSGNVNLSPKGYFEIRNIFGSQKERTDIKDLTILGGQEVELSTLRWNSGFALGLYSANLVLDVNGQNFEKSTMFWVINWWQALIVVLILLVVVFVTYKGIKGYTTMKKKLEKIKDKKE